MSSSLGKMICFLFLFQGKEYIEIHIMVLKNRLAITETLKTFRIQ